MEPVIEIIDVSLAFQTDSAPELAGINLRIDPGEVVSLVGPSGCGKSTLLRLITGVLQPSAGTIAVFGEQKIPGWSALSFVPQDAALLPWRTVRDNVLLPLELDSATGRSEWAEKVQAALNLVNLSGINEKYPHQLSGGMRQRVALARALVGRPRLLLLDEPFAALDAITRSQLHLELLRIREETGITVLLVTHNIFEAVFLSHRVMVMGEKPGRILGGIPIDLPAARTLKLIGTPQFSGLAGSVQDLLEQGWSDEYGR